MGVDGKFVKNKSEREIGSERKFIRKQKKN